MPGEAPGSARSPLPSSRPRASLPEGAALLVFLLTLAVYVAGLCPSAYWLDSSEFAAASALLGVAHPPGHPLSLLLGKAASLLPLGPVALRVGFGQALCAAAAAALLCLCGARLAARAARALGAPGELPPWPLALAGAGAALCTSLGFAVAFQAVRPEVYALHRLLALLALYGALRHDEGDGRGLPLLAVALGLGLANHHFLTILLILPAVLLLRSPGPRGAGADAAQPAAEREAKLYGPSPGIGARPAASGVMALLRHLGLCVVLGALGLLLYAYLPLRAAHHPLADWGAPTTLARIYWVVSAQAFQKSVKEPVGDDADVLGALIEQVGPVGLLLSFVGLYLLLRQRPTRRLGAYLLAVVALHAIGRAALGFDVANPDAHGYLVPAGDTLALLGCAGVGGLVALGRRALTLAVASLSLVAGLAWGAKDLPGSLRPDFWDLDTLVGAWLHESPSRARLLSSNFQTVFGLWYLMGVEGQRPDLEQWHPHFLMNPGYREDLLARHPRTPDLPTLTGTPEHPGLRVPILLDSAKRRTTLLEYDVDAPQELVAALSPFGLAEIVAPPDPARAEAAQRRRQQIQSRLDLTEPETRRVVLWRSYLRAQLACRQRDRFTQTAELRRSREILNGARSPELDELERTCR